MITNLKERLVELVMRTPCVAMSSRFAAEHIADNLIANGVTVNEWRPVSEPPKENGRYLVIQTDGKHTWQDVCKFATNLRKVDRYSFKKGAGWYGYDSEWGYYEIDDITHWMPLPELPKEVE